MADDIRGTKEGNCRATGLDGLCPTPEKKRRNEKEGKKGGKKYLKKKNLLKRDRRSSSSLKRKMLQINLSHRTTSLSLSFFSPVCFSRRERETLGSRGLIDWGMSSGSFALFPLALSPPLNYRLPLGLSHFASSSKSTGLCKNKTFVLLSFSGAQRVCAPERKRANSPPAFFFLFFERYATMADGFCHKKSKEEEEEKEDRRRDTYSSSIPLSR